MINGLRFINSETSVGARYSVAAVRGLNRICEFPMCFSIALLTNFILASYYMLLITEILIVNFIFTIIIIKT